MIRFILMIVIVAGIGALLITRFAYIYETYFKYKTKQEQSKKKQITKKYNKKIKKLKL